MKRLIPNVIALLLVAGCSTTRPVFEKVGPDPKMATVYIYRPSKLGGSAADPTVYVDGVKQFDLSNGGYQVLTVKPGQRKIQIKKLFWSIDEQVELRARAGEVYYLRFEMLESSGDRSGSMGVNGLGGSMIVSEFKDGMIKDFRNVIDARVSELKTFSPRAFFVNESFGEKDISQTRKISF